MRGICANCGTSHDIATRISGKLLGMAGGAIAGPAVHQATGSKLLGAFAGLVGSALGAAAGHTLVDAGLSAVCPRCRGL